MSYKILTAACVAVLATGCMSSADETRPMASRGEHPRAQLVAADGSPRGSVRIIQVHGGISVSVQAENMPPGVHGAHVHAVGRCDAPDFASAGPHWNPTARQHGKENPAGPHWGDAPNLTIGADGRGMLEFEIPAAWVRRGDNPLLDGDGAAFVIHANADDYRTDPSGNSGGRIACAVLRYPASRNVPG